VKRLLLLLLLACGGCTRAVPPGTTELLYASPYPPTHPFSRADIAWMTFVERRSGGRLRIRPSWGGALLSSDQSMEELRHGVADVGLVTPIYARGGAHLIRTQAGFYLGVTTPAQQLALYRCMEAASPEFAHEMAGLHVLALQGGGLPGIITRNRPVRTLDDVRGMRLRAPSELLAVLRELGADPVNMPMNEVYSALAKGVIDGVLAPIDTFRSLHFAEVTKFNTALAVPRGAYPARVISEARWQRLPADLQKVLNEATPVWEAALNDEIAKASDQGLEAARKGKITLSPIAPAEQARFDRLYDLESARNAAGLAQFGIDGTAVYAAARRSVGPGGSVACRGAKA
jgi:TRAP-type transport system periplasmic protein